MTEQEQKDFELFKEWWNKEYPKEINGFSNTIDEDYKAIAEESWFARAKLDKERNEKENL